MGISMQFNNANTQISPHRIKQLEGVFQGIYSNCLIGSRNPKLQHSIAKRCCPVFAEEIQGERKPIIPLGNKLYFQAALIVTKFLIALNWNLSSCSIGSLDLVLQTSLWILLCNTPTGIYLVLLCPILCTHYWLFCQQQMFFFWIQTKKRADSGIQTRKRAYTVPW